MPNYNPDSPENQVRSSKYPERHTPDVHSLPVKLPEPIGDAIMHDVYQDPELKELAEEDGALLNMRTAHQRYSEGLQKVREAMSQRSPDETEGQHFLQSKKIADRWLRESNQFYDRQRERAESELTATRLDIQQKLKLDESSRASEVRGMLRSMSDEDRISAIDRAIQAGDNEVMGAVIAGSPMLAGLDRETVDRLHGAYVYQHAPELVKRQKALEKALKLNERASLEAVENVSRLFPADKMKRIHEQAERALKARQAVNFE